MIQRIFDAMHDEDSSQKQDDGVNPFPIVVGIAVILVIVLLIIASVAVFQAMLDPSIGAIFSNVIEALATPVQ
jgi:Ni,Fe-hydrogenase I cytochrome b subunit